MIVLASQSPIKTEVVEDYFGKNFQYRFLKTVGHPTPEQPINSGCWCAGQRLRNLEEHYSLNDSDILIAIENGMTTTHENAFDITYVIIKFAGQIFYGESSLRGKIPAEWYEQSRERMERENPDYSMKKYGLDVTLGKSHIMPYLEHLGPNTGLTHDNWTKYEWFGGFDRKEQISTALNQAVEKILKDQVRVTPDFPKEGVLFKDLNRIMADRWLNQLLTRLILSRIALLPQKPTKIVGLDARGFIYGNVIATHLGSSFVMARKKGKQPESIGLITTEYSVEYRDCNSLELEDSLFQPDDIVLIWNDLIATGGTMLAARDLVQRCDVKQIYLMATLQDDSCFEAAAHKFEIPPTIILK